MRECWRYPILYKFSLLCVHNGSVYHEVGLQPPALPGWQGFTIILPMPHNSVLKSETSCIAEDRASDGNGYWPVLLSFSLVPGHEMNTFALSPTSDIISPKRPKATGPRAMD